MEYQLKSVKGWKNQTNDDGEAQPILLSRSSTSNLTGSLTRVGKVRANRSAVLPQVNRRLQTFEKDYKKLLVHLCENLCFSRSVIIDLASSSAGKNIHELIASGSLDTSKYLQILPEEVQHTAGTNESILKAILDVSKTLHRFSYQQSTPSLSIVKCLRSITKELENSPHLLFDNHASEIVGWWFPQFIEILSVVLLLSEPNTEGTNQVLKDTNTLESYFNCYRANLVIVVYLLLGGYLYDQGITRCLSQIEKVNPTEREQECALRLEQECTAMTRSMRSQLSSATQETGINTGSGASSRKVRRGRSSSSQIHCWMDVYESLPQICSTCAYLFISDIPPEIASHLKMDVQNASTRPRSVEVVRPLQALLQEIAKLGVVLESIRDCWPVTFSAKDTALIVRTALVLLAEGERLSKLKSIPFAVPESWDNWSAYVRLVKEFVVYIILLARRKASRNEAEQVLGKMIVQTRFMNQLTKIEASEECVLSIF